MALKNPRCIAVDFDQTIALYHPGEWKKEYKTKVCPSRYKAVLNKELVSFLRKRKYCGDKIVIYTSRHIS